MTTTMQLNAYGGILRELQDYSFVIAEMEPDTRAAAVAGLLSRLPAHERADVLRRLG